MMLLYNVSEKERKATIEKILEMDYLKIGHEMFEKFVRDNNLVIRAIPEKVRGTYDVNEHNLKKFPQGEVKYLPEYKREMIVVFTVPAHAGEILVTRCKHTMGNVEFSGGVYFKSFDEIYEYYSAVKGEDE